MTKINSHVSTAQERESAHAEDMADFRKKLDHATKILEILNQEKPVIDEGKRKETKTLIFGAGASVPFFAPQRLDTAYLTNQISDKNTWEKVFDKYNLIMQRAEYYTDLHFADIVRLIDNIKMKKPQFNFEEIANDIDKLSLFKYDMVSNLMLPEEIEECESLSKTYSVQPTKYWKDIPFLLRMIIAESIIDVQKNKSPKYDVLLKYQKAFLNNVSDKDNTSIISFNYDDLLLDSFAGFETGFDSAGQFNCRQLNDARKTIIFPHGHIRFFFYDKATVKYFDNAASADCARWKNLFSKRTGETLTVAIGKNNSYTCNTFITTGQNKPNGFNLEPYNVYMEKIEKDIRQSSELVIIGYSFEDNYFNEILKTCPAKRIVIVDYKENAQKESAFKDIIKDKCGASFLDSITDFYFKGYAKFLEEYNNGRIK
jgi:hypothetical protein